MRNIKTKAAVLLGTLVALTAFVVAPNMAASKGNNGLKSFHGKVSDLASGNDGFTISRANGSTVDFAVNETTVYKHIGGGFKALTVGEAVEVKARKAGDPRVARKVEAEGADGRAADGSKIDDHGGHGTDDGATHDAGDDHGSGGHGADDGANQNAGDDKGGTGTGTGGSGADDGATHNAGDDKGGKHGGNDNAGDDKGGHGHGSDD